MITLQAQPNGAGIKVPTKMSEISPKYLTSITSHIGLSDNQALIAMCVGIKLSDLCFLTTSPKGNDNSKYRLTSIIAKANVGKDVNFKFNVGDVAVISNTDLERGLHFSGIPSVITSDYISAYLLEHESYRKDIITKVAKDGDEYLGDKVIYMLQFKIVPLFDIKAVIDVNSSKFQDEFRILPTDVDKK